MPTTFANQINGNDIYAKRAECDAAGNDIQTTYATKSEVTTGLASKQDTISDLATIRSGASAGATAIQPSDLATVATTGSYNSLSDKPTIPTATSDLTNDSGFITLSDVPAQVNADWNAVSGAAEILNKPVIPEGVPTYTAAEEGKVLGVVEVSGSPALDWVQGGGGASNFEIIPQSGLATTPDGKTLILKHGSMLPVTQYQYGALLAQKEYSSGLKKIYVYNPWQYAQAIYNKISVYTSAFMSGNTYLPTWYPIANNHSIYIRQKSGSWSTTYSDYYIYDNNGRRKVGSVYRRISADVPTGTGTTFDTTIFDVVGDWSSVNTPITTWYLGFTDTSGNLTDAGMSYDLSQSTLALRVDNVFDIKKKTNGGIGIDYYNGIYVENPLPASTSSDENKVLTVNSSGSPAWTTPSGGGSVTDVEVNGTSVVNASGVAEVSVPAQVQTDWDATSGLGEILNKPVVMGMTAGNNVTITEGASSITIAATDTTYTAGAGLNLSNGEFSVDSTVVALQTDIPTVPTAGNMLSVTNNVLNVTTTAGITDIQQVASLPVNPVATVLYLIPET